MGKQVFGYTDPAQPRSGEYVKFVQAFVREDGNIEITVRDERSRMTTVVMPPEEASELGCALSSAAFPFTKTGRPGYDEG